MKVGNNIVISQSMLFPWVGLLEQIRLADIFVHYDDVQFSKGSFVNRVQVKLPEGVRWMTVPLKEFHLGQTIEELQLNEAINWRQKHLEMLNRGFAGTPYKKDALNLVEEVYSNRYANMSELARESLMALVRYFRLDFKTNFIDVCELDIGGASTERVLSVVKSLSGNVYITGHGAQKYLDHKALDDAGVLVQYMDYKCDPYPQLHGPFTPYVSSLDLVANCGREGVQYIQSSTVDWRSFINESAR